MALVIYESDLQLTLLLSRLLRLHLSLKNFIKDLFLKICFQNMYNLKYFNIMCRYFLRMIIFFKRDLSIPAGVKFKCGQSNLADLKILAYTKHDSIHKKQTLPWNQWHDRHLGKIPNDFIVKASRYRIVILVN